MNIKELNPAMMSEVPVTYNGIEYKRISAIIFRKAKEGKFVQVELEDKKVHSVTIADPNRVIRVNKNGTSSHPV